MRVGNTIVFTLLMRMHVNYPLVSTTHKAEGSKAAIDFICAGESRCLGVGKQG